MMLTNVPTAVNRLTRAVLQNHPNSFSCQVFRKTVTRQASSSMGGLPTLGGLGVLDTEDEEQIEYAWVGDGYALPVEPFSPSPMMDRQDATNNTGTEFRFILEPEVPSGSDGHFDLRSRDIVYLLLGTTDSPPKLAFEVVGVETTVNLPPYTSRYILNRRDDLHVPAGPPPDPPEQTGQEPTP